MANTYFNDAIIGNSGMLVCLTRNGELTRLFGPTLTIRSILKNGDGNLLYGPEKQHFLVL